MPQSNQKFNVLITGVTNSVGRHLASHLVEDKRIGVVLGVARDERPYYFKDLPAERFIYRSCDILKYRELNNLFHSRTFKDAAINTVIHLAFKTRPARSEDVHTLNVNGTKSLLEACVASGTIKKFIFKSSNVVYKLRPHNPTFLDENADLNFDPDVDQWIKDRVDADMICRSFMDNKHMSIVILRMSNIIGRNVGGQFNAYFDSPLILKPMGFNPMINLLHMKDVIHAIKQSIFVRAAHGIYNIAGQDTAPITTIAEMANSRVISLPEPMLPAANWIQRKLGMTTYYYSVDKDRQKYTMLLDTRKAQRELGFVATGRVEF